MFDHVSLATELNHSARTQIEMEFRHIYVWMIAIHTALCKLTYTLTEYNIDHDAC